MLKVLRYLDNRDISKSQLEYENSVRENLTKSTGSFWPYEYLFHIPVVRYTTPYRKGFERFVNSR